MSAPNMEKATQCCSLMHFNAKKEYVGFIANEKVKKKKKKKINVVMNCHTHRNRLSLPDTQCVPHRLPFFRIDYHLQATLRVCYHRYKCLLKNSGLINEKKKYSSLRKSRSNDHHLEFYGELGAAIDITLQQTYCFSSKDSLKQMKDALKTVILLARLYKKTPELKFLCEGVVIQISEKLKSFTQHLQQKMDSSHELLTTTSSDMDAAADTFQKCDTCFTFSENEKRPLLETPPLINEALTPTIEVPVVEKKLKKVAPSPNKKETTFSSTAENSFETYTLSGKMDDFLYRYATLSDTFQSSTENMDEIVHPITPVIYENPDILNNESTHPKTSTYLKQVTKPCKNPSTLLQCPEHLTKAHTVLKQPESNNSLTFNETCIKTQEKNDTSTLIEPHMPSERLYACSQRSTSFSSSYANSSSLSPASHRPFLSYETPKTLIPPSTIEIHGRAGETLNNLPKPKPFLGTNASHPISIEALQEIMQKRREHNEKFAIVTFGSLDPRDSTFSNPVQNTSCF